MPPDPGVSPRNRLWTPWRMAYVGGSTREPGCIFCNRLDANDDTASLIVHRGRHAFVILNLYPYNTGHLMVVPHAHVQDPSELDAGTQAEMAALTGNLTRLLRRVLDCAGFNVGMNIGDAAGAGIADHLHQHIVPRWVGDANFMPILGSTKVLPELLAATYGKIRAEIERDISSATEARVVAFVGDPPGIVVSLNRLPVVRLQTEVAVWKTTLAALSDDFDKLAVLGWAGPPDTRDHSHSEPTLTVRAAVRNGSPGRFQVWTNDDVSSLPDTDREVVRRGLAMLEP